MTSRSTRRLLLFVGFLAAAIAAFSILAGLVAGLPWMGRVAAGLGIGAGICLALYLLWRAGRAFLWRVGRRLAFSYFLIGVLPIPMILALLALNGYLLAGYFLGHLYRDVATDLQVEVQRAAETRLELPGGGAASGSIAFAEYRNGARVSSDERFSPTWPEWLTKQEEDGYVALADGTPSLAAAAGSTRRGVVALFDGDLEAEITRRTGVWVKLLRPDDPGREKPPIRLQILDQTFALQPLTPKRDAEERSRYFGGAPEEQPWLDRPLIWWGELSGSLLRVGDGETVAEYLTASLNATPRSVMRHLFSGSAELDTVVGALVISTTALLAAIYIAATVMALVIIFTLSRAVNRLSSATAAVQRGDFSVRIPVRRNDQVGELQSSFNEMTANLEMLVATAAQNEALEKELEIARRLQKSLLPTDVPRSDRLEFATMFRPSAAIGGDYFDILPTADGRIVVVVADVAGHGLPAGLQMAMVKAALVTLVEENKKPVQIMSRLHKLIRSSSQKRFFVTATMAEIDVSAASVEMTNAGHSPTYLLRGGEVEEILLPGNPLGALGERYGQRTTGLEEGDAVVWLSDGLIEATNDRDEPFGYERVRQALTGPVGGAREVRDRLVTAVREHAGKVAATDDQTLVVMRFGSRSDPVKAGKRTGGAA